VVNVKCFGDSTGEITFDASGGEPPYTYEWTGPNGFTGNTSTINNIEAGNYELIFTDDGGCVSNYSFEVMQPSSALKTGISPSDSICYGTTNGLLQISPSGGDGPYDVLWSNGHNGYVNENLAAGIYLVSVSDNDGCIAIDQQEVVERGEINVNISQTPSRCFGSPDGTAIINSVLYGSQTASISDFEYLWNSVPVQTNSSVTGLIGGETYTVIVTDINQCSGVETVIIESPESISAEIIALQNVNCFAGNDGSIDIRGTGGTGQFSYLWDISANSQTTSKAEMLKKGNYSLTITDSNQCTGVKNFTVEEPLPLSMDFNVIDVSCYGESAGRAEADVEGGVGPYEYSWSNGSNAKAIENVISEQYLITITDANACTLLDSVTVLEPESPIMSDVNIVDVQCFDGSNGKIEIESMGGSGFYQYSINGNEFFSSSTISNLSAGTYDIYVKDFKGCFDTLTNIILNQPPEIIVDLGADKIIPYGSTVNLIAEIFNTSGNVEYSWFSDNLNLLSCTSCPNPTFEGIREASFELVIYDENGCKGSDFITVRLENYSSLQVPSAFTPNNDGENDILLVFGNGIKEVIHFKIFDRWGELVYENADFQVNDEALGWDGKFKDKDAPSGIYYWFAEVEFDNGFKDSYNGNTSLLR
jgi:gliding motility-associated-like protein